MHFTYCIEIRTIIIIITSILRRREVYALDVILTLDSDQHRLQQI